MKKLLIIPITFLAAGSFFLTSCGNVSTDTGMKPPVQNNADTSRKKADNESDEKEKKEQEEKKRKKNKKVSFFLKPAIIINDADRKAILETQIALWM